MTNSTATQALRETAPVGTAIELVVMDMAGTTVSDDGRVIEAFDAAATAVGLAESGADREDARRYVLETMGQSKIEVFEHSSAQKTVRKLPILPSKPLTMRAS